MGMEPAKERSEKIRDYWEREDTISLKDDNLRQLELSAICRWLAPEHRVVDVGCGDGINTLSYSLKVRSVMGIDYSGGMICRARRRASELGANNVEFHRLSVDRLTEMEGTFDAAISQRCLINLTTFEEQKKAIERIQALIVPGGLFLMLECFDEGRQNLNALRERMGLEPIPRPWHNLFFGEEELMPFLRERFELLEVEDFSLYFLITRVLNPVLGLSQQSPMSIRMDEGSRRLQQNLGLTSLSGFGAQRLLVLRSRASH